MKQILNSILLLLSLLYIISIVSGSASTLTSTVNLISSLSSTCSKFNNDEFLIKSLYKPSDNDNYENDDIIKTTPDLTSIISQELPTLINEIDKPTDTNSCQSDTCVIFSKDDIITTDEVNSIETNVTGDENELELNKENELHSIIDQIASVVGNSIIEESLTVTENDIEESVIAIENDLIDNPNFEASLSTTEEIEELISTPEDSSTTMESSTTLESSTTFESSKTSTELDTSFDNNDTDPFLSFNEINNDYEIHDDNESIIIKDYSHENNSIDESIEECHFMSFDEWKKQKEDEAKHNSIIESNKSININESGKYINDEQQSKYNELIIANTSTINKDNVISDINSDDVSSSRINEDQGKTYKDKFNYASVDCAATVVKTNSNAKGASSILTENKDSYLINQCSLSNKFVVIELCQDILVENVVIGNFEFFSSMFRNIRISVSDRFPVNQPQGWKLLGNFEALNLRDIQNFEIENPLIWARYLKLEILSHYGDEFYCPISLIRVHGKTMMDEFKMTEEEHEKQNENELRLEHEEEYNNNIEIINNFKTNSNEIISNHSNPNESMFLNELNIINNEEEDDDDDECKVFLPHLRLNEFLNDFNSTDDWCDANIYPKFEIESSESSSRPISSSSSSSSGTLSSNSRTTTQESIYKNIMKRLSLLESNATLSLLYIEEQSKLLSTAFTNLEKRQSNKLTNLVNNFNTTMNSQLITFKKNYLSIQNDAIKLFKIQQKNHQDLLNHSNNKILLISNDLKFQKNLSIFNTLIIMCLLIYVIITRDAYIDDLSYYFEDLSEDEVENDDDFANDELTNHNSYENKESNNDNTKQNIKKVTKNSSYPVGFNTKLKNFNHHVINGKKKNVTKHKPNSKPP